MSNNVLVTGYCKVHNAFSVNNLNFNVPDKSHTLTFPNINSSSGNVLLSTSETNVWSASNVQEGMIASLNASGQLGFTDFPKTVTPTSPTYSSYVAGGTINLNSDFIQRLYGNHTSATVNLPTGTAGQLMNISNNSGVGIITIRANGVTVDSLPSGGKHIIMLCTAANRWRTVWKG